MKCLLIHILKQDHKRKTIPFEDGLLGFRGVNVFIRGMF